MSLDEERHTRRDRSGGRQSQRQTTKISIRPGDEILLHRYQNDDNQTLLTDLHTIEYAANQPKLYHHHNEMPSDSEDNHHPILAPISEVYASKTRPLTEPDGAHQKLPVTKRRTSWMEEELGDYLPYSKLTAAMDDSSNLHHDDEWLAPRLKMVRPEAAAKDGPRTPSGGVAAAAAAAAAIPTPQWEVELDSECQVMKQVALTQVQQDGHGRVSKEAPKNNPNAAAAREGDHDREGTAAAVVPNWQQDFASEIQPMPTRPVRQTPGASLEFDDRGRATKASMAQDADRVGAYAIAGPAPLSRRTIRGPIRDGQPAPQSLPTLNGLARDGPEAARDNDPDPNEAMESASVPIPVLEAVISENPSLRQKMFILGAVLLAVVVAVAVAVLVAANSGGEEEEVVFPAETLAPTEPYIGPIPGLLESTLIDIEIPFTVANQAYEFCIEDPNWNSYEDWRRQQRFAMACLFYTFGGRVSSRGGSQELSSAFYDQHECEWILPIPDWCPGGDGILRYLRIGDNFRDRGLIPPEIALLSNLEKLEILEGTVVSMEELLPLDTPNSLASLKDLIILDSGVTGSMPSTFGLLTSLTNLDLSDNGLGSTLPSEIGLLSNLTRIILTKNSFTGTIPEELGDLTSLVVFEAQENSWLDPFIPSGFCSENRTAWQSMTTNFCPNANACCSLLD